MVVVSLPCLFWFVVSEPAVQTLITRQVSSILSKKLDTKVSVESVDFKFFNRFIINGLYISDQKKDTLLSVNKIDVGLNYFSLKKNTFHFGKVELDRLTFKLKQDTSGKLNLQFIIKALASQKSSKPSKPIKITARELQISNLSYVMRLGKNYTFKPHGMNYHDLEVRRMQIQARDIKLEKGKLTADVEKIALHEKCGFNLKKLAGKLQLSSKEIRLDDMIIEDDFSKVRAKYYSMQHKSFRSYKQYVHDVIMSAELDNAEVDFKTIGFFAPKLRTWPLHFTRVNGIYRGPVANMHGENIRMTYNNNTQLGLDFSIVGLSRIDSTRFRVKIKELKSQAGTLEQLARNFKIPMDAVAPYLQTMGDLSLKGTFDGFFYKFDGAADITSKELGDISIQARYDHRNEKAISAQVQSKSLDLGKLLRNPSLKQISFQAKTEGKFKSADGMSLTSNVQVDSLQLTNTLLRNISADAILINKSVSFLSHVQDTKLKLKLDGKINWEKAEPEGLVNIDLQHCNLQALKWRKSQDSSVMNAKAVLHLRGNSIDNLNGVFDIAQFRWKEGHKLMQTSNAQLKIDNSEENRGIRLYSSIATAEVISTKPLSKLIPSLKCMLNHYLPNLAFTVPQDFPEWAWGSKLKAAREITPLNKLLRVQNPDYIISFYCKALKDLGSFISEGFVISDSTGGRLAWNQEEGVAMLRLLSPRLQIGKQVIEQSSVVLNAVRDSASCQSITNRYSLGGLMFKEVHTDHQITRNRIHSVITYQNDVDLSNSGHFSFDTEILPSLADGTQLRTDILPSYLVINNDVWSIPQSSVHLHGKAVSIQNLSVKNYQQHIDVSGSYSTSDLDTLKIRIGDFQLRNFNSLTSDMKFEGNVSGYANIMRSGDLPIFVTSILGEKVKMGEMEVGTMRVLSQWNNTFDRLDVLMETENKGTSEFSFMGHYSPDKTQPIQGKGVLNHMRLALIKPLVKTVFSDIQGQANGYFTIDGSLQKPILNGKIALDDARMTVDFTRSTYRLTDTIRIANNDIVLRDANLKDGQKGHAALNLVVSRIGYPEFSYHIAIDPKNLASINLKENDNRPIYGTGYATGQVVISGNLKKTLLKIVAATNENTNISIPLQKSGGVNENSFVQFKKKPAPVSKYSNRVYDPARKQEQKATSSRNDFGIEMQIAATPEAEVRLVIDPKTGDAIEAMGRGNIKIEIYPGRDIFRLFGSYVIERGEYTFSIQNLINKRFKIEPNSRINFNGSINDASLNINTTYKLRASLGTLLGDTTERYAKKVPIDCIVSMTGKLTSPTLKFSIDAPSSDLETRGRMRSALNTEEKTVQQFIYLLVMNQFMNDQQSLGIMNNGNAVATAGVTIGEMISGALSSFVANTFKNVDLNIGVNYRVNSSNQTDWEVNFSTNITDRVSLTGNVDMPSGAQNKYGGANNGEVSGDIDLEVRLDKTGNVKLKAFSHSKDQFTDDLGTARHGLGIFYQKDFNSFKDLFRRKTKK